MSYGPPHPGSPPPPGGGYGPPSGGYGPPSGGYGPPGAGGQPPTERPKNYLVFNILGIFGCTIIGIIGTVFAAQVNSKWQMGDYAGAQSSATVAKILGIIGFIGFCLVVVYVIFLIIMAAIHA